MADDPDTDPSGYVKGALCKIHPQEDSTSMRAMSVGSEVYAEDELVSVYVRYMLLAIKGREERRREERRTNKRDLI